MKRVIHVFCCFFIILVLFQGGFFFLEFQGIFWGGVWGFLGFFCGFSGFFIVGGVGFAFHVFFQTLKLYCFNVVHLQIFNSPPNLCYLFSFCIFLCLYVLFSFLFCICYLRGKVIANNFKRMLNYIKFLLYQ